MSLFVAGKILENLTLGLPRQDPSPPSQPPTPPSTPLSPPTSSESLKALHVPTSIPQLPNISITRAPSPGQNSPQNLSSRKPSLETETKKNLSLTLYTNGVGMNLSTNQQNVPESPQYGPGEIDMLRNKMADLSKMAGITPQAARVSKQNYSL